MNPCVILISILLIYQVSCIEDDRRTPILSPVAQQAIEIEACISNIYDDRNSDDSNDSDHYHAVLQYQEKLVRQAKIILGLAIFGAVVLVMMIVMHIHNKEHSFMMIENRTGMYGLHR